MEKKIPLLLGHAARIGRCKNDILLVITDIMHNFCKSIMCL